MGGWMGGCLCNRKSAWTKAVGIQKVSHLLGIKANWGSTPLTALKRKFMTYEEKTKMFNTKDARELSSEKTLFEYLPLEMKTGSSTHNPDRKGGVTTCDIVLYIRFAGSDWFRPYGRMPAEVIEKFVKACNYDIQVISLMEMLSAKVEKDTNVIKP